MILYYHNHYQYPYLLQVIHYKKLIEQIYRYLPVQLRHLLEYLKMNGYLQ